MTQTPRLVRATARRAAAITAVALGLVACSETTPTDAAQTVIETELAEQSGMTFTDPECTTPADEEVGTEYSCTATNADGATVTFDAVIDPDDMIFVAPSNLVYAEDMVLVEEEAASVLGEQVGVVIDPADVNCPDETTVLDGDILRCEITDASNGDVYELEVTFGEFILREGYSDRFYLIGDQAL